MSPRKTASKQDQLSAAATAKAAEQAEAQLDPTAAWKDQADRDCAEAMKTFNPQFTFEEGLRWMRKNNRATYKRLIRAACAAYGF